MMIFYTWFENSLTGEVDDINTPTVTDYLIGDIGDFVERDGIGYIISDYTVEIKEEF